MPQLDLIGLTVADMPRALDFYRALGLEIPDTMNSEGHVEVTLPGGLRLAWDTVEVIRSFDPDWQPATGHRVALAFLCADAAEVDATYAHIVALGYASHRAPFDAPWGQRYAQVLDPDDNVIDLFAPLD